MKRIVLFLISALFVFALTSCDDQGRKCNDPKKCPRKQEDRQRRW